MSKANVPNPFHSAKRMEGISVMLTPDDLQRQMLEISPVAVAKLFEDHGSAIAAIMIRAGLEAAGAILAEQDRMHL